MKHLAFIFITLLMLGCSDYSGTIFPDKQWIETEPEKVEINSELLNEAVNFLEKNSGKNGVQELMIIRGGRLIYKGDSIHKVHGVWSCTKSFVSTCLGLLIDDNKTELNTYAGEVVPALEESYSDVTLRHLTTMTSGYIAQGDTATKGYTHGSSKTPFIPGAQPLFEPGTKYSYWDAAMNQFANVLTQIAGEPLDELFKRRIADPIGMDGNNWYWRDFGKINGLKVVGGAGNQSKGIYISANELARLGLLFLNDGNWNGNQLIGQDWIKQASKVQVPATMEAGTHLSKIHGMGVYGFNWWVNGIQSDGKRFWSNAPVGTYAASGYNNNKMFIIPEWDMVIVRLGLDANDVVITNQVWNEFFGMLANSVKN